MPRQPEWFQHVPGALEALEALEDFPAPVVDRAALEQLLGVSRRTAIRLLNDFGGYQAGRTFLIRREDLVASLEAVGERGSFSWEVRRRQRLAGELELAQEQGQARRVRLPVTHDRPGSLPPGVHLSPGRLEVEFASPEHLLARLYEIAQLAGSDFEAFRALLENTRQ